MDVIGEREQGREALEALGRERVDHRFKAVPLDAYGLTVAELTAQRRNLFDGGFPTPLLTLSEEALEHNLDLLEHYTTAHGLAFAPHGKTSMAPELFAAQLARGAWGITVAVPYQARVCRAFGVRRIFLANELVDAAALRWVGAELDADPGLEFIAYADSVRGVELMDAALRAAGTRRPLDVVVELGAGEGARTGARTEAECAAVAEAVAAAGTLRLVGVAGYEGEVPDADPLRVRAWLRRLVALAADLDRAGHFADAERIVISAGGSAWFDAVAEVFGEIGAPGTAAGLSRPVLRLLRSGAYVTHDDDHYRRITPFNRVPAEGALEPAFRLWAQVVSRPAPGQAFLNAGKRDAPYDLGLPTARTVRSARDGATRAAPAGFTVTKVSDQHTWLELPPQDTLEVGDWVALGLSHPCTTFDKWQLIPRTTADGTVTGYVRTFFG
ncbi:alanine racemase [Streptomyces sp. HPF1205]|uniref:alanine racemase n=1 Tax=Streptomyces sp. HPF1205 TaxID=2873262 RepID=UPI001CEDA312|nr:alanine racemase [Streptomyces sp. HPF1205]